MKNRRKSINYNSFFGSITMHTATLLTSYFSNSKSLVDLLSIDGDTRYSCYNSLIT